MTDLWKFVFRLEKNGLENFLEWGKKLKLTFFYNPKKIFTKIFLNGLSIFFEGKSFKFCIGENLIETLQMKAKICENIQDKISDIEKFDPFSMKKKKIQKSEKNQRKKKKKIFFLKVFPKN